MDMAMGFSDESQAQWSPQKSDEPQRKRNRNKNYSDEEKQLILDGVEASYEYIKTNTPNPTKVETWQQIAVEATALGFAYRNAEDIRLKWTHWSSEVRRKLAKLRATYSAEDLGSIDDHLNPLDQRMRALIEGGGGSDPQSGPSTPVRIKEEPYELISESPIQDVHTSPLLQGVSLLHHYQDEQDSNPPIQQTDWHPEQQQHPHQPQEINQGNEGEQSWHPVKNSNTYTSDLRSCRLKRQLVTPNQLYRKTRRKRQKFSNLLDNHSFGAIDNNDYGEEGFHDDELDNDTKDDVSEMVNGINGDVSQDYYSHTSNKVQSEEISMAQTQRELLDVSREISGTLKLLLEQQIKMNAQLGELLKRQDEKS